ncbi:MAG TPA: dTDP-4-dehydrorhamnose reductase [Acidimicrobiia bacterium]|nr:dTDP-4-dehydrorhamnose reductase [Acidimicrobiia bacterium]
MQGRILVKVLITGASGQVGSAAVEQFSSDKRNDVVSLSHSELNIASRSDVLGALSQLGPNLVINAAAMTNVDACEERTTDAFAINALAVRNLVQGCENIQAHLIHLSTDFVFDGNAARPYSEFDITNPLSVYGTSKLGGDNEALSYSRSTVLRVAWVYGNVKGDFFSWVLDGVKDNSITSLIDDQISTPTYSFDIAHVMQHCATHRLTGLIHVANEGETTRLEMGKEICNRLSLPHNLSGIPAESLKRPARRPAYSALSTDALTRTTGIIMRPWKESLDDHIKRMQNY